MRTENRVSQHRLNMKVEDKISKALKEFKDSNAAVKADLKTLQIDVNNLNASAKAAQNWLRPVLTSGPILLAGWGAFRNLSIKVLDQYWVFLGLLGVAILLCERFLGKNSPKDTIVPAPAAS